MGRPVRIDRSQPFWQQAARLKLTRLLLRPACPSLRSFLSDVFGYEGDDLERMRSQVSKYESGRSEPTYTYLDAIEEEFNVDKDFVMKGREDRLPADFKRALNRVRRGDFGGLPKETAADIAEILKALRAADFDHILRRSGNGS